MADILQSEIRIIHTVEGQSPTETQAPTDETKDVEEVLDEIKEDAVDLKGLKRKGGRISIQRRLANYAMQNVERLANLSYDNEINKQTLYGDSRSVQKIQNNKTIFNLHSNNIKATVGSAITSAAVGNFAIFGLQLFNMSLSAANTAMQNIQQTKMFNEKVSIDMFESSRQRERLIVGTYNRR